MRRLQADASNEKSYAYREAAYANAGMFPDESSQEALMLQLPARCRYATA